MPDSSLEDVEAGFRVNGPFRERDGSARHAGGRFVNKKLCLVATDKLYLARLLLELSGREECYFVKYTTSPRDGMYLGRVFLMDERLLGELWARYKRDPKLMCSLQDDDFTLRFRNR